jgi:NAD(P)-dependent dehydrogenase (short-subunit alcohol dehydrogenase family)
MSKENKTVIITGGANGIGLATAIKFLEKEHSVIIIDKEKTKELNELNSKFQNRISFFNVDVSNASSLNRAFKRIISKKLNIVTLVNNAATCDQRQLEKIDPKDWEKTLQINLIAPFIATRLTANYFVTNKIKGSIINVTSIHSKKVYGGADYSSSKAGLDLLTKEAAAEYAKFGIRVNSVAPGSTETRMITRKYSIEKLRESAVKTVPLKRLGLPEDIANAIYFLSSADANYITGIELTVDGGLSLVI